LGERDHLAAPTAASDPPGDLRDVVRAHDDRPRLRVDDHQIAVRADDQTMPEPLDARDELFERCRSCLGHCCTFNVTVDDCLLVQHGRSLKPGATTRNVAVRMPRSIESAEITGGMWLALSCSGALAQSGDWRYQRINGSSEAGFESSIAALQNSLPRRRREDLDIALALLWMTDSLGSAGLDLDRDGDVDRVDMRLLADRTKDLLADIERGDLLMSI